MDTINELRRKLAEYIDRCGGEASLSKEYIVKIALETEHKIEKLSFKI